MNNILNKWHPKAEILSTEEQNELILKAQKWDIQARNKLIEYNIRLVISVAQKYAKWDADIQDLIQEWVIWFIKWMNRYSIKFWVKFSYYIRFWIEADIIRYLKQNNPIKIAYNNVSKIYAIIDFLERNDWKVDIEYLCKKFNIDENELNELLSSIGSANLLSLDENFSEDKKCSLTDILGDSSDSLEQIFMEEERKKIVQNIIKRLSEKEKRIIINRFWLNGKDWCTLQKIWNNLWVSRERVRQIEQKSLEKLKKVLISKDITAEDVL